MLICNGYCCTAPCGAATAEVRIAQTCTARMRSWRRRRGHDWRQNEVQSRLRRLLGVATAAMVAVAAVGCGTGSGEGSAASSEEGPVTLEFAQWWAPELPEGSFQELMTQFESQNPNIKVELLSGPYASTKQQLVSGAASKTLPDVVGLDGAWVNDFAKQGAHHRPLGAHGGGEVRRKPAGQPDQGGRQDLHDSGGQLRLPALRERGPAVEGRRQGCSE